MSSSYTTQIKTKTGIFVLLIAGLLIHSGSMRAQVLSFEYGTTAQTMAETIAGNGVQLLNPILTCADSAYGLYNISGIANFPNSPGVVLTTGRLGDLRGPNTSQSTTTEWDTPGDPIIDILAGQTSFDGCALEFDVVPVGDTLRFNFTFASEEYREYVGTPFNDAFGFFISGPGITGDPGLGNLSNMALIPNTNDPVGINTVNDGNPDIGFPAVNPGFFHFNPLGFSNLIQYDGWTLNLVAQRVVTPCDTFRLKLVIADVADREWDSAVFIEAIESNSVVITAETEALIDNMVEGCNSGTVTFTRQPVTSLPLVVTYFLQGTAQNGIDYVQIGGDPDPNEPKFITILPNQASASINVIPIDDGIIEGNESLLFYVGNPLCTGTIQDSLEFIIQDSLGVVITPSESVVCLGDSLTFAVVTDGISYQWSPATFLNDATLLEPTSFPSANITYNLVVFAGGCSSSAQALVSVTDIFLSATVSNIACNGLANGAISLNISGGTGPFGFAWVGPNGFSSIDQNIADLSPGSYAVLVTDQTGCTESLTATILQPSAIMAAVVSPTFSGGANVSCFQANDGQATVIPSGGTPPYQFLWSDPNAQTSQTAVNLVSGTYTVNVTDANSCVVMTSITLTQPNLVSATLVQRIDVLCNGQNSGSITIAPNGGTGPYSVFWNTLPPQSGTTASNLAAGIYTATITDVNGCSGGIEITIVQPALALSGTISVSSVACNGENTGAASVVANGGTPPYNYNWSSSPGENVTAVSNLSAGPYTLTVIDANNCSLSLPYSIAQPNALTVNLISQANVDCFGNATGALTVGANGGTGPYTYAWNNNPPTSGPTISGLPAGSYTVLVVDANSCESSLTVSVLEPAEFELSTSIDANPSCFDSSDGAITAIVSGGTSPFSFQWNTVPPTLSATLTGASAGSYIVTATDANGCSNQETISLLAPEPIIISITVTNVTCFGASTGVALAIVTGGTQPYAYAWNDPIGQTTQEATGLGAGAYNLVVTDANGCVASISVVITQPSSALTALIDNTIDVLCFDLPNGSATATASGGSGSYSYQWDDPAMQQTATASNLAPGNYSVTITDNNGCPSPVVLIVTISGPNSDLAITAALSSFGGGFNLACFGDTDGSIDVSVSGGTAPYTYLWDLPGLNTSATEDLSNLGLGTYILTVTDSNGCSKDSLFSIAQPTELSVESEVTPSLCFGLPEGGILLSVFGGFAPYTVQWSGPNGFLSNDLLLTNLEGGVYTATITDTNGCSRVESITVPQPDDLLISVEVLSDYNGFNTSCSYSADGSITISAAGGLLPYTYQWNTVNNPNFSDQISISNLAPGAYEIVVIDANGCVQNLTIPLLSPDTIAFAFDASIYPNGFNISCFGAMDGSIDAAVTGGVPAYSLTWTGTGPFGPVSGTSISNLDAGEYLLQVVDLNGCLAEESILLTQPNPFALALSSQLINGFNISCASATDGSIDLVFQGGATPIITNWTGPNGFSSSFGDLFNLGAGEYCVEAIDASGCIQLACITLTEPLPISIQLDAAFYLNGLNLLCGDSQDGQIDATITGGVMPFTYAWLGPLNYTSQDEDIVGLLEGTYCLTVTDMSGCSDSACISLIAPEPTEITAASITAPSCFGAADGAIDVNIIGGDPAFVFAWTGPNGFSANSQNIASLEAGIYCLGITDAVGCEAEMCFNLAEPAPLQLSLIAAQFEGGFEIGCSGDGSGAINAVASGGSSPYDFAWIGPNGFSSGSPNIEGLMAGEYCLTLTDTNNCQVIQCILLEEPIPLSVNPLIGLPDCGEGEPASINLQTGGGTQPYTYNWSNGASTEEVSVLAGQYSVIVSDANGCQLNQSFNILLPSQIQLFLSSPTFAGFNIACNGASTGIINLQVFNASGSTSYSWSGPNGFASSSQNINNLIAGTYCVTVTDALGCTGNQCITLNQATPLEINLSSTANTCNGVMDGSATALIAGGVPTYNISWSGPNGFTANGSVISNLEAGNYCAEVIDQSGCITTSCIDVNNTAALDISLTSPEIGGVNISCFGANSGSIVSIVAGGTPPYTYNWTGPNGYASTDESPNNLFAGTYCLVVTDANQCNLQTCITLTQGASLDISFQSTVYPNGFNVSCGGICDANIDVSVTGGALPLGFSWVGPGGFASNQDDLASVCAGNYLLTITDANGCEQSATVVLTAPPVLMIDLESPTFGGGNEINCFGESTGTILSNLTGGVAPFNYSWTGPAGFTAGTADIASLSAGTYQLVATDSFGCTVTGEITLTEPSAALAAVGSISTFPSGSNISCTGANDGSIATAVNGGTAPYQYNWNGPNGFVSNAANIDGLAPGVYTLVVEDANSCVLTLNLTLTEPPLALSAQLAVLNPLLCNDSNMGSLSVTAAGGSEPYSIAWTGSNGFNATTFQIDNLTAATYSYTLTDENGCVASGNFNLTAPNPILASAEIVNADCQTATGGIALAPTGGTSPYAYLWSNGQETQELSNVSPGIYTVTITDFNNCTQIFDFAVGSFNSLELQALLTDLTCSGDSSGMIDIIVITGTEPIAYFWGGPDGFESESANLENLTAGVYELTADDANGCTLTNQYEINEPNTLVLAQLTSPVYSNGFNLSDFQTGDGTIDAPQVNGGIPAYSYSWTSTNGYQSNDPNAQLNLQAGVYFLTVTDLNGCASTDSITLTEPVPVEMPNGISPNGDGFNDGFTVRGLDNFPANKLIVFNRWGNLVYEETNYRNLTPWTGRNESGEELPEGTYFVVMELTGHENLKGYLEIRR